MAVSDIYRVEASSSTSVSWSSWSGVIFWVLPLFSRIVNRFVFSSCFKMLQIVFERKMVKMSVCQCFRLFCCFIRFNHGQILKNELTLSGISDRHHLHSIYAAASITHITSINSKRGGTIYCQSSGRFCRILNSCCIRSCVVCGTGAMDFVREIF